MVKAPPAAASALGALITWFDSRPNNDDTGVTAGIFLLAVAMGVTALVGRLFGAVV